MLKENDPFIFFELYLLLYRKKNISEELKIGIVDNGSYLDLNGQSSTNGKLQK